MKPGTPFAALLLLPLLCGCAARPAYFGRDSRLLRENGEQYWEASAAAPSYLRARMLRRRGAEAEDAIRYDGTLALDPGAPVVMVSTFTVEEGSSATIRFELNAGVAGELARSGRATAYSPGSVAVVVSCARGECTADAAPLEISMEGRIVLKARKLRKPRRPKTAAQRALARDVECTALHDRLRILEEADSSGPAAAAGAARTRARLRAESAEREYARRGCAVWLEDRGGAEAAERRVRLSRWTSLRRD
ncbi:MAG TPA: hypothetical protein VH309_02600 [Elusimicrobiota bacterium]|jgi:hypothetical protein|nr:hypothetical protein [Elusimicrobiota bacterium]